MLALIRRYLLIIALLAAAVNAHGIYQLYVHCAISRIVVVQNINDPSIGNRKPLGNEEERRAFLNMLQEAGMDKIRGEEQIIQLMRWIMNSVHKVEPERNGSPYRMLMDSVKRGDGMLCGGMATVFHEGLALLNIPSRLVILNRNVFDCYDAHVTVEVLVNNKWRIYDPTFNVSFKKGDALLSAQELHDHLMRGTGDDITPIFYGNVAYPARLDLYYLHYLPLFNNVFVVNQTALSAWEKAPPLHFFYGTHLYYQDGDASKKLSHIHFQQNMYFLHIVVLPTLLVLICIYIIVDVIRKNAMRGKAAQ